MRSGVTSRTRSVLVSAITLRLRRGLHLLGGFEHVLDGALHVEGLLGNVVVLAFDDFLEAAHRIGDFAVFTGDSGELLGDVEGLREELLYLSRAGDGNLVLFREFVDSEDSDDALQILVALQNSLDALRNV